jgi:hypothetical protein
MTPNEYFKLPEGEKDILRGFCYANWEDAAMDRRLRNL